MRVQSDRRTKFKGAVKTFMNRSGIPNIESRSYYPQSQRKNERSHDKWIKTKSRLDILNGVPGIIVL